MKPEIRTILNKALASSYDETAPAVPQVSFEDLEYVIRWVREELDSVWNSIAAHFKGHMPRLESGQVKKILEVAGLLDDFDLIKPALFVGVASECGAVAGYKDMLNMAIGFKTSAKVLKEKEKTSFVVGPDHPKNKGNKGHFPIPDEAHARNALSRVAQYDKAPDWWSGSLDELKSAIKSAVKKKFPKIEVSD